MILSTTLAIASTLFGLSQSAAIVGVANTGGIGIYSESCELDLAKSVVYLAKNPVPNTDLTKPSGIVTITSDLTKIAMNKLELTEVVNGTELSLGIERNGNILYVNKAASLKGVGSVNAYDISKKMMINGTSIGMNYPAMARPGPNGLCIDPNNTNILYTTAVGANTAFQLDGSQGVWKVDTTTWTTEQILSVNTTFPGSNYSAMPNGCTVRNGKLYVVEFRLDGKERLLTYDISTKKWMTDKIPMGAQVDSIVYDSNGVFYAALWAGFGASPASGALASFNVDPATGKISNFKPEIVNLVSPADICIDGRMIGIPAYGPGTLTLVNLDSTRSPTSASGAPTKAPVKMTVTTTVKMNTTTTKKPADNSALSGEYIIGLVISLLSIIIVS